MQRAFLVARGFWTNGHAYFEGRAVSHFAVEVDRPSMTLHDDGPGDGQSLPRAASHLLGGEEGIEDLVANRLGNAGAGVLHVDFDPVSVAAGADGDRSPLARTQYRPVRRASMACAALTIRFRSTWFRSPGRQVMGGKSSARSVTASATYFHSFLEIVKVFSMAPLTSMLCVSSPSG